MSSPAKTPAAQPTMSRSLGLDCLRSLGILIVLCNHGLIGFIFSQGILPFKGWVAQLSASAVLSIEWLFLLSGYLIGAMMIPPRGPRRVLCVVEVTKSACGSGLG